MDPIFAIDTAVRYIGYYLIAGLLFAVVFLLWGARRLAPRMAGASVAARLVVLPGIVLLWPLIVVQWRRFRRFGPVALDAHRRAATAHEAP